MTGEITQPEIDELRSCLAPLIGLQFKILQIPAAALKGFEPSQIGTIIGVLMDACIPQLPLVLKDRDKATLETVGLRKHEGILKDREGYPDYLHASGKELS